MPTYIRLRSGKIMIVQSDNKEEQTMLLYPVVKQYSWDPKVNSAKEFPYSEIDAKSDVLLKLMTSTYAEEVKFP